MYSFGKKKEYFSHSPLLFFSFSVSLFISLIDCVDSEDRIIVYYCGMQYKQEIEKVTMMDSSYMAVPKSLSLAEDREVQRTRKILIIILGVCVVSVF